MKKIDITDIKNLQKFSNEFVKKIKPGNVVFLSGDLGSGKTAFVKCILKSLNFKKEAKSPSFNLVNIYKNKKISICHMDLYRLTKKDDLESFIEYFDEENISFVEWPNLLIKQKIKCDFHLNFGFEKRKRVIKF